MLHGAFTPPYCPALPAQRLGSTSLCGGARSSCAHPQKVSRGRNMRSCTAASGELLAGDAVWAVPRAEINSRTARIQDKVLIQPPTSLGCSETVTIELPSVQRFA